MQERAEPHRRLEVRITMTLQFRIADHGDFDGIWAVLMDGKAALGHLGIDQWQGAYPTQ